MTATTPQRAFGYVRVSSEEEGGGQNASIAAQRAAIEAAAAQEGVELVKVFEEPDVSGRKLHRKQFDRMVTLATAAERPVDIIYVFRLDRYARNLFTHVVTDQKLEAAGVRLISLTERFSDDASGRLLRNFIALINEKYSIDAAAHTRKNRRENASAGYFNGGRVPYGYEAQTVAVFGKKERKQLFVHEAEAKVVQSIFSLALQGVDGERMGTRAISEYLKAQGHRMRGSLFHDSSVDGILTRSHYRGFHVDRTADEHGHPAEITVACPQLVDPDIVDRVAALRASTAPRVTPPRTTSSKTLLKKVGQCGAPTCGSGLTIRTGKSGQYGDYICNSKATRGAKSCGTRAIRQDALDGIVIDTLLERVLEPERLKQLLVAVLERSDAADERRRADLHRVTAEHGATQRRLRNLLEMVETGLISPRDPTLAGRLAELREALDQMNATRRSIEAQSARGALRINEATVKKCGKLIADRVRYDSPALRQAYVDKVVVTNDSITITGRKAALEAAILHGNRRGSRCGAQF
ncbi:recombinase family protein [Sphingomonas donggukensis]|uniref:Recombinase family protein n=1 Tax=Sphingomonas donggukensis TaxID=2949093 RepID=A0ABY4TUR2_9SPHN|nr:recombinase family protein [Sphingomonas donggukensis]URW75595.1 recombinase family protein [Sphingomonas donggukensis]